MGFPFSVFIPGIHLLIQVDDNLDGFRHGLVSTLSSGLVQRLPNESHHFPGTGNLDFVRMLAGQQ